MDFLSFEGQVISSCSKVSGAEVRALPCYFQLLPWPDLVACEIHFQGTEFTP
jgi:hypothetical protein